MKAKIKATGEIINIADYARVVLSQCDSWGNPIELGFDEVEILQETTSDIDWEKVRIKAAISALQGFCSNSETFNDDDDKLAKWSVSCADYLIAELKKGGDK